MTLENQLAEYGQLQDEMFGPISVDEVTIQTVGAQGGLGRHPVFRRSPTALAVAVLVAAILVFGGVAFLMNGSREADPVDQTTTIPLSPALRQNGEVIMYTNDDPRGSGDLVARNPDTGEVRTLVAAVTLGESLVGRAAWSADGRWAAYEVLACGGDLTNEDGTGGLWVTNGVDEPRQVTKPCFEDGPADIYTEFWEWSPTGAQLVVARQFNDGDALILIDPATGDRTDLGKTAGDVTSLAWSPDGTLIAYGVVPTGSPDGISDEASVHSVRVDGGGHFLLASSLGGHVPGGEEGSGIRWSPDGARIAVLAQAEENRLYLMDADGSNLELVTGGIVIEHVLGSPNLVWSPDGTRVAYATYGGRDELQVWNGSFDGSAPILVFDSAPASDWFGGGPVWSPDGTSIAFRYSPTPAKAWLVANADGTGDVHEIEGLQYSMWRGGWYFCECYG